VVRFPGAASFLPLEREREVRKKKKKRSPKARELKVSRDAKGGGTVTFSDIPITKQVDKSSTTLFH